MATPMINHDRLTRQYAALVAFIQLGMGVSGLILDDRFRGVASFQPARDILSPLPGDAAFWWSGILVALALYAIIGLTLKSDHVRNAFSLLCGYWTFWVIVWTVALFDPGGGPWAPFIALILTIGNARPVISPVMHAD